jgi:hypothetical protein
MTEIIRAQDARRITGLSKNVEDRKMEPFIPAAQLVLRDIMGKTGFDLLSTAVQDNYDLPGSGNDALRTLRNDYIWPFLAWRVVELSGTRMWVEPDRNGTFNRNGETYGSVDSRALGTSKTDARDMAGIYQRELVAFLTDNVATYTWYEPDTCGHQGTPNYTGGVITEPATAQRRNWYNDGY